MVFLCVLYGWVYGWVCWLLVVCDSMNVGLCVGVNVVCCVRGRVS